MNAAIYARKSTEQNVADEAKSVTRQIENAKAYAAKRGWTVHPAHIYMDDGISGAEFQRRPGFQRMLSTALVPRPPFKILIVSEQKSIGREMAETMYVIKQLAEVQARRKETEGHAARFESGRLSGRPPKHATQNLLAGLATCGACGGGLIVETGGKKRGRYPEYICARHRSNGACPNALRVRVETINEAVSHAIEEHALTPEAIEQVIRLSERDDIADHQATLERERADIEKRMGRLVAAIEAGGAATALLVKIREMETRLQAIAREIRSLHPIPRLPATVVENRLAEWRRLLRQSITQGRTVLQRVLFGRITFTRARATRSKRRPDSTGCLRASPSSAQRGSRRAHLGGWGT